MFIRRLFVLIVLLCLFFSNSLYAEFVSSIDWKRFVPDSLRNLKLKKISEDTISFGNHLYNVGKFRFEHGRLNAIIIVRKVGREHIVFFNSLTAENGQYMRLLRFSILDLTGDKKPEIVGVAQILENGVAIFNTLIVWKNHLDRFKLAFHTDDFLLEGSLVDFKAEDFNGDKKGEIYIGLINSKLGFLTPYIFAFNNELDDYIQIWPPKDTSFGEFGSILFYDYDKDGTKELILSYLVSIGSGDHSARHSIFFREVQTLRWREQELYTVADVIGISRNREFLFSRLFTGKTRAYIIPKDYRHLFVNASDLKQVLGMLPRDAVLADAVWFTYRAPQSESYRLVDSLLTNRFPPYCSVIKLNEIEIGIAYFIHDKGIKDIPFIDDNARKHANGFYLYCRFYKRRGTKWTLVWESPQLAKGNDLLDKHFYRFYMKGNRIYICFKSFSGKKKTVSAVYPLARLYKKKS